MKSWLILGILLTTWCFQGRAQTVAPKATEQTNPSDDIKVLEDVDYPELKVVPRASQRLRLEAQLERSNFWYVHWPFLLSSATTIFTTQQRLDRIKPSRTPVQQEDIKERLQISSLIGYGWFAGMLILSFDKPYQDGLNEVSRLGGKTKDAELTRERMSEEVFDKSSRLLVKLRWISFFSNAFANAISMDDLTAEGQSMAALGILASFLPLVFEHRYNYNFQKQEEYKRKIYSIWMDSPAEAPQMGQTAVAQTHRLNVAWTF